MRLIMKIDKDAAEIQATPRTGFRTDMVVSLTMTAADRTAITVSFMRTNIDIETNNAIVTLFERAIAYYEMIDI